MSDTSNQVNVEEIRKTVDARKIEEYNWHYQGGRRYATRELGDYFIPNDDPEIKRLNEQHWTFTQAKNGRLYSAPIDPDKEGFKALDVGCGTGIWAVQMAEAHPKCHIVGMDISPIQPDDRPSNVEWLLHDVETEWPFVEERFDYVHLSLLNGSLANFARIMEEIMRCLKPGGYIEHQEFALGNAYVLDNDEQPINLPDDVDELPPFLKWSRLMEVAAEKRGRSLKLATNAKGYQMSAGLQDVTQEVYNLPIGTWPKDEKQRLIGSYMLLNGFHGLEGLSTVMFTTALGWSLEAVKEFVEKVKAYVCDDSVHKFLDLYVIYGRKVCLRDLNSLSM